MSNWDYIHIYLGLLGMWRLNNPCIVLKINQRREEPYTAVQSAALSLVKGERKASSFWVSLLSR